MISKRRQLPSGRWTRNGSDWWTTMIAGSTILLTSSGFLGSLVSSTSVCDRAATYARLPRASNVMSCDSVQREPA